MQMPFGLLSVTLTRVGQDIGAVVYAEKAFHVAALRVADVGERREHAIEEGVLLALGGLSSGLGRAEHVVITPNVEEVGGGRVCGRLLAELVCAECDLPVSAENGHRGRREGSCAGAATEGACTMSAVSSAHIVSTPTLYIAPCPPTLAPCHRV